MGITFDFIELLGGWILHIIFKRPTNYFTEKFSLLCILLGAIIMVGCMFSILWIESLL